MTVSNWETTIQYKTIGSIIALKIVNMFECTSNAISSYICLHDIKVISTQRA